MALEDRVFTERRLRFYGTGVAAAWALTLAWLFLWVHWLGPINGKWRCLDFGWMWVGGRLAGSLDPSRIYEYSVFSAAQLGLFGFGRCVFSPFHFDYPPTLLFFTYPFGILPYPVAFVLWNAATLALYLGAAYAAMPRPATLILALTPFAITANIILGHNGFLTAGLIGLALAALERRPWLAGILLGLLSYKPQFGVLFPLALLAARDWRALAAAAAATIAFGAAAAIAFGFESWPMFVHSLLDRGAGLSPNAGIELNLQSVYGVMHWFGADNWLAWGAHIAVAGVVAAAVWAVWARPFPYALKAAVLAAGAVTVTPYVMPYDLCILTIAAAYLVRDGLARGFAFGERTVLLLCWAGVFFASFRSGPVLCVLLLLLVIRRLAHYRRTRGRRNAGDWTSPLLSVVPAKPPR